MVDLYTATLASVAAAREVPRLGDRSALRAVDRGLMVCPRDLERVRVKAAQEFFRTNSVRRWRIKRELLLPRGPELVVMFRPSMMAELERTGALRGALAIWSMWSGYLEGPSERRMQVSTSKHRDGDEAGFRSR